MDEAIKTDKIIEGNDSSGIHALDLNFSKGRDILLPNEKLTKEEMEKCKKARDESEGHFLICFARDCKNSFYNLAVRAALKSDFEHVFLGFYYKRKCFLVQSFIPQVDVYYWDEMSNFRVIKSFISNFRYDKKNTNRFLMENIYKPYGYLDIAHSAWDQMKRRLGLGFVEGFFSGKDSMHCSEFVIRYLLEYDYNFDKSNLPKNLNTYTPVDVFEFLKKNFRHFTLLENQKAGKSTYINGK